MLSFLTKVVYTLGITYRENLVNRSYFKYLLSLILFASNGVIASFISLTSYEIVFLRSSIGSVLLVALFYLSGNRLSLTKHKPDVWYIALSGLLMAAGWLLLFESYRQIGVGLTLLINYFGPAIVVLLSVLLLKYRLSWQKVLALFVALSGVFLISGNAAATGVNLLGVSLAILSAFAYAFMVLANKQSKQIVGFENATLQLLFATVFIAIYFGLRQGFHLHIESSDWLPILWIGLVNTGIACFLYFSAMGNLSAQTIAISSYIEPLVALMLSMVFLDEALSGVQFIGAGMILSGALLGELSGKKVAG